MYVHAQAPCRIGIAGGGTDLPAWTGAGRTGLCLSLAIQHYAHAAVIERPDRQVVAAYSRLEHAPRATEIGNGLIRESALAYGFETGFEVHTMSEIPSYGSGLGASSAIAVSLAACFARMQLIKLAEGLPLLDRRDAIAKHAWMIEIDRLRRSIGRQDHMAAAYGGLRLYAFEGQAARVERTFVEEDAAWVADRLLLVRLPDGHDAGSILSAVTAVSQLQSAIESVPVAVEAIEQRMPMLLGRALAMGQRSKETIPGAAPIALRGLIEDVLLIKTVTGCKVAGAGGGGHLVVAREAAGDETEARLRALGQLRGLALDVLSVEPDLKGVRSEGWV